MAKPIYQDDAPPPRKRRRKRYPKGKHPRPMTPDRRDMKLLRLPYQEPVTITRAAELMEIGRRTLQCSYLCGPYRLPTFIEVVRNEFDIATHLRRIGP